ncbi:MAG: mannonate dehydratase, partial [Rhodospirillales bacterium]|nr:mannonate dehydratase [Rhodospirillales bacterium]
DELLHIKAMLEEEGLTWLAIENFDPAHWYDVLLDGPKKAEQLENLRTMVRAVGEAGIPIIGYNFSLAGVTGRTKAPTARGAAEAVGMEGVNEQPVPTGMVWNMIYDAHAVPGAMPPCTHDELWERVTVFLNAVLPAAEAAGVTLAAHPDDPPVPTLRSTPRLVYRPHLYDRLLAINPSQANQLEFCLGTVAEMAEGDVYETLRRYASAGRVAYIHFRNVRGKAPHYRETFVDEGDIDMQRVLRILRDCDYDGVMIPDHTPLMTCAAPWHAGMAYAMGWMRAAMDALAK